MLERLFSSRVRIDLVAFFVTNPDRRRHIRGLAQTLDAHYSAVWRELQNLEQAGLVISEEEAGRKLFRLNPEFPLLDELRSMIMKTVGAGDRVRQVLAGLDGIQAAFIYGSYADGRVDAYSDIDLMVIGEAKLEQLSSAIAQLDAALGRSVNTISYTQSEWRARLADRDPFALDVMRGPKLMLVGPEDAL